MNELKQFDKATNNLRDTFIKKYFGKLEDWEFYWVGTQDKDQEVLSVGDYFFNLDDIVSFLRYKYTKKELFTYYDYMIEGGITNIRSWKPLKK